MPDGEKRTAGLRLAVSTRRVGNDVANGDAEVLPVRELLEWILLAVSGPQRHESGSEAVAAVAGDGGAQRCPLDRRAGVRLALTKRLDGVGFTGGEASGVGQHDVVAEHRRGAVHHVRLGAGHRKRAVGGQQFFDGGLMRGLNASSVGTKHEQQE